EQAAGPILLHMAQQASGPHPRPNLVVRDDAFSRCSRDQRQSGSTNDDVLVGHRVQTGAVDGGVQRAEAVFISAASLRRAECVCASCSRYRSDGTGSTSKKI